MIEEPTEKEIHQAYHAIMAWPHGVTIYGVPVAQIQKVVAWWVTQVEKAESSEANKI